MNEEILSGLKMALERGFNLEESIQSFINAGYNESEVRESASFLSKGFSPLPSVQKEVAVPKEEMKPEAPKKTKLIILILVLLILLAIVIPLFLFKDKFLSVIDSIFP